MSIARFHGLDLEVFEQGSVEFEPLNQKLVSNMPGDILTRYVLLESVPADPDDNLKTYLNWVDNEFKKIGELEPETVSVVPYKWGLVVPTRREIKVNRSGLLPDGMALVASVAIIRPGNNLIHRQMRKVNKILDRYNNPSNIISGQRMLYDINASQFVKGENGSVLVDIEPRSRKIIK